ncbi:MAG: hypothetical protein OEQ47_16265 [Acidimicrobiia bacterium]|nr:hypothetical protein [Acidimicrobiia bacterium]
MKLANERIESEIAGRVHGVSSTGSPRCLDDSGRPNERHFADDLVRINEEGYSVLAGLVGNELGGARPER